MAIANVVTRGYGPSASIAFVVTRGYSLGTPVTAPDVVGETQATATTTLQGEGLTVVVATAYSDVVAVGLVISQDPTAGTDVAPGSSVTITVSLGPEPVGEDQNTGGWLFLNLYDAELQRRRKDEEEREQILEQIEDSVDREIAQILQAEIARESEIARLKEIAQKESNLAAAQAYSDRVAKAYERVVMKGNYSAVEALERELERAREEEDFLALALSVLLDD